MHKIEQGAELTPALWPELWIWLPQLSECELKVWLYLRAWLPGGGQPAEIPLRQIQQGTGLSRSSVIRGQAGLRTKALLGGEERPGGTTRYWWLDPAAVERVAPASSAPPQVILPRNPVQICDGGRESNRIESNQEITKESDSIRAMTHSETPLTGTHSTVAVALEVQMRQITTRFQPGAAPIAVKANITRLLRLWHTSGRSEVGFADLLHLAVERTEARMIRPGARPVACPMSYLFTVLERLLFTDSTAHRSRGRVARSLAPSAASAQVSADSGISSSSEELVSLSAVEDFATCSAAPLARKEMDSTTPSTHAKEPDSVSAASPLVSDSPVGDLTKRWQQALLLLRLEQSPDDFQRILRYTVLQDFDPTTGQAHLVVPADWMRRQISTRLAEPIRQALAHVLEAPVQIVVTLFGPAGSLYCAD